MLSRVITAIGNKNAAGIVIDYITVSKAQAVGGFALVLEDLPRQQHVFCLHNLASSIAMWQRLWREHLSGCCVAHNTRNARKRRDREALSDLRWNRPPCCRRV